MCYCLFGLINSLLLFLFVGSLSLVHVSMQLLELVEKNEVNRTLLTLLDENIANAHRGNQVRIGGYFSSILF